MGKKFYLSVFEKLKFQIWENPSTTTRELPLTVYNVQNHSPPKCSTSPKGSIHLSM